MSDQPNTQPMRERLTKLFEFLKAYSDLRYPPVRNISEQPRCLWLKDLPKHSSVELFRDLGKSEEEIEDSDIVLRLTRSVVTHCPPPPAQLQELGITPELASSASAPSAGQGEVVERVIRRAQELRVSWQPTQQSP